MRLGPDGGSARRVVYVRLAADQEFQRIALHEGMCRDDVLACLRVAAGLEPEEDLMLFDAVDDAMVPVSAALPAGARLALRLGPRSPKADAGAAKEEGSKAKAAGADAEKGLRQETTPKTEMTPKTAAAKDMVAHTEAMKHFSKISNYLANDRTLLAWTRTALCLGRTAITFAALSAASEGWLAALNGVTISLAVLSFAFFVVGCVRFVDVRDALDGNDAPRYMLEAFSDAGRSIISSRRAMPVHFLLGVTVLVISVAAGGREFQK